MKRLKWILIGAAVVAVPVMVGVFGVSIVQAASGSEGVGSIVGSNILAHPIFGDIDMKALLAEELGITVEELEEAKRAAFESAVAMAVDEGTITQEQADQILEGDWPLAPGFGRFKGELPEGFEPGAGWGHRHGRFFVPKDDSVPEDNSDQDTSNTDA